MSFLDEALEAAFSKKIRTSAQYTNRVSMAGVICARRLQWHRSRWSDAKPIDTGLARRFELGLILEPVVIRKLEDGGLTVIQRQRDMQWPALQLTGHIDGLVVTPDGDEAVLDVKTCSRFVLEKLKKRIHLPSELLEEGGYIAGYVAQVGVYALLLGKSRGFLLFIDKESFDSHTIEVRLDDRVVLDACEAFLKRCEAVNKAIADGVDLPPETGDHCERCPFVATCAPDMVFGSPSIVMDDEVSGWLDRRAELKAAEAELKELEDGLRAKFKEPGESIVGNWLVKVTEAKVPSYTVKERTQLNRRYLPIINPATVVATAEKEEVDAGNQGQEKVGSQKSLDQPSGVGGAQEEGGGRPA